MMKHVNFNHKFSRVYFVLLTLIIMLILVFATSKTEASIPTVTVTINTLEKDDVVTLRLMPEVEGTISAEVLPLFEQSVRGNGKNIQVQMPTNLPDGYYQLLLQGSSNYFRDPKGYFFQVVQQQIINPMNRGLVFDLIPASTQSYPPCTDDNMPKENLVDEVSVLSDLPDDINNIVCMAERMISLSAPLKLPSFGKTDEHTIEHNILTTGYHYFGPSTTQDNNGVRGQFVVVDPGVCHSGCNGNMFAASHVYAQYPDAGMPYGQRWMEVGWAEVSWQANNRYIFQFDSADLTWNLYDQLSTGTKLLVRVRQSSGNTWRAERYVGGSWVLLRERNIGFSTASNGYNKGEVYTDDWHPYFPSATTDQSYLLISGTWRIWDTRYATSIMTTHSYDTHVSNSYYKFCVHFHDTGNCVP